MAAVEITRNMVNQPAGLETANAATATVSDDSGSDSGEDREERRVLPMATFLIQHVAEQIRSLYSLSSLLRRPGVSNKYLRSTGKSVANNQTVEVSLLRTALGRFDLLHVTERVREWRGLTKSTKGVLFGEETAVEVGEQLACVIAKTSTGFASVLRRRILRGGNS